MTRPRPRPGPGYEPTRGVPGRVPRVVRGGSAPRGAASAGGFGDGRAAGVGFGRVGGTAGDARRVVAKVRAYRSAVESPPDRERRGRTRGRPSRRTSDTRTIRCAGSGDGGEDAVGKVMTRDFRFFISGAATATARHCRVPPFVVLGTILYGDRVNRWTAFAPRSLFVPRQRYSTAYSITSERPSLFSAGAENVPERARARAHSADADVFADARISPRARMSRASLSARVVRPPSRARDASPPPEPRRLAARRSSSHPRRDARPPPGAPTARVTPRGRRPTLRRARRAPPLPPRRRASLRAMDRVPAVLPNAETLPWHFVVPSEGTWRPSPRAAHPRRGGDPQPRRPLPHPRGRSRGRQRLALTPGDARREGLTRPGEGDRGSDAPRARVTPHARREDDARRGRARDRGRQSQRESAPTPGSSSLGASDATGGIDRSRGASSFYFEYDAPPSSPSSPCRWRARCTRASSPPPTKTRERTLFERCERCGEFPSGTMSERADEINRACASSVSSSHASFFFFCYQSRSNRRIIRSARPARRPCPPLLRRVPRAPARASSGHRRRRGWGFVGVASGSGAARRGSGAAPARASARLSLRLFLFLFHVLLHVRLRRGDGGCHGGRRRRRGASRASFLSGESRHGRHLFSRAGGFRPVDGAPQRRDAKRRRRHRRVLVLHRRRAKRGRGRRPRKPRRR